MELSSSTKKKVKRLRLDGTLAVSGAVAGGGGPGGRALLNGNSIHSALKKMTPAATPKTIRSGKNQRNGLVPPLCPGCLVGGILSPDEIHQGVEQTLRHLFQVIVPFQERLILGVREMGEADEDRRHLGPLQDQERRLSHGGSPQTRFP